MVNHKFVFISGLHRSGTSLLFQCIRDHPEISGFKNTGVPEDEGQHLQSVYPVDGVYEGPGHFGFNPAFHLTEESHLVSSDNANKLFNEWKKYWDLEKPFLLEKSPPNLVRSRFLQALFPNAYFITLLRHPVAVSYATHPYSRKHSILPWKKWGNKSSIHSLIAHWLVCHEQFSYDKKYLRNLLVLKYEEFVVEPQTTLKKIYEFLGVKSVPFTREVRPNVNDKYFSKWEDMQNGMLTKFYTQYITQKFERRVNQYGYSLKNRELIYRFSDK